VECIPLGQPPSARLVVETATCLLSRAADARLLTTVWCCVGARGSAQRLRFQDSESVLDRSDFAYWRFARARRDYAARLAFFRACRPAGAEVDPLGQVSGLPLAVGRCNVVPVSLCSAGAFLFPASGGGYARRASTGRSVMPEASIAPAGTWRGLPRAYLGVALSKGCCHRGVSSARALNPSDAGPWSRCCSFLRLTFTPFGSPARATSRFLLSSARDGCGPPGAALARFARSWPDLVCWCAVGVAATVLGFRLLQ